MFRRKDAAYDTQDLLQDVMSGIEDDELLETSSNSEPKPAIPANNNQPQGSSNNSNTKGASIMDSSNTPANPPSNTTPAAAAAAAMSAPAKPAPAAAFRPQAPRPQAPAAAEVAGLPAETSSNLPAKASKRVLTVGHDIHMKGEISTCDRLVIEGSVDASLSDVHTVEIAQTGSFKGNAEIEDAEISGAFEGDLIVNGRLTIYASGRVSGNVAYGEIEIERGGKLTGSIKTAEEMKAAQGNKAGKKAA